MWFIYILLWRSLAPDLHKNLRRQPKRPLGKSVTWIILYAVALQQTQAGAIQHHHRMSSAFYKLEVENSQQKVEKRWRSPTTMDSLQQRLVEVADSPRLPKVCDILLFMKICRLGRFYVMVFFLYSLYM